MNNLTQEAKEPNVQGVCAELARVTVRVEELADARELEAAILRNGDKPLIPWEQAKKDLGL